MNARLLGQLGWVFHHEAEKIFDAYAEKISYAACPRKKLTAEESAEVDRLRDVADAIFARAEAAGLDHTGTDGCFGEPEEPQA